MAKRGRQRAVETEGEGGGALPALRHARLVETLRERGQATVNELVALFGGSHDTIRRDLDLLERHGLLVRTHGGAVNSDRLVRLDTPLLSRMDEHIDAKRRIGAAAAALVRDRETLIINGGSTVCQFAAALGERRDLTIVTNNLRLPPAIPDGAIGAIHILGGTYWPQFQVTIGTIGFSPVAGINVDTAVLPVMGGEDFSYMLNARPGVFIFAGNGDTAGLHNPAYDFNDELIPHGISYWVRLAETALAK